MCLQQNRDLQALRSTPYKYLQLLDVDNQMRSVSYVDLGDDTSMVPLVIIPGIMVELVIRK